MTKGLAAKGLHLIYASSKSKVKDVLADILGQHEGRLNGLFF